jgi:hypothetical protein
VGVEPTIRPAKGRIGGFEGRDSHRTIFAPVKFNLMHRKMLGAVYAWSTLWPFLLAALHCEPVFRWNEDIGQE